MALLTGRTKNTNDVAAVSDLTEITVNVAVVAALANPKRIYLGIQIESKDAYIRYMPALDDPSNRKGFKVKKDLLFEMTPDNYYSGEISIINKKNNEKPKFSVTEY